MVLDKGVCLRYYKRKDVQEAITEHAKDKEIGTRYNEYFGKRPDILRYPNEIIELAKKGATSFHASEEIWESPISLSSDMSKKELGELRTGWDLVLDIDCKFINYSKVAAELIIKFLKYTGVKDISCKFSGNKGFHIGVPFEAFPQKVGDKFTKDLFPEAPKKIALYIKEKIKEELGKRILQLEENDFSKVVEKTEATKESIVYYREDKLGTKVPYLNVEPFLEIDTVLISSRHLYRMPYSLHEKSGLISLPLDPEKVTLFEKEMAHPDKLLTPIFKFLERDISGESAKGLLVQALDYETKIEIRKKEYEEKKQFNNSEELEIESPIREEFFPPCIKNALTGMQDGKKRIAFCLINFLGKIGWNKREVELFLNRWNDKNPDKLRQNYFKGQLQNFKPGERLPPNCTNDAYYLAIGICKPDNLCKKIKNPVNYTIVRWKMHLEDKEKQDQEDAKQKKKDKKKITQTTSEPQPDQSND